MKRLLAALALGTALAQPQTAAARPVNLTVDMKNYFGRGAYVALYVTDAAGNYKGSLWMSGGNPRYYKHLRGWFRATRGNVAEVRGITGASIGSGRSLTVTLDLNGALFDAGYQLHIDAAVENFRDSPNDVVLPLTRGNAGRPARGRRYVGAARFDF